MDKISVIVPVYNVKKYLKRCVDSIENQTYKNLEIILIDDGSTDGSGELCDTFNDERVKVIHKENEGLGLSRNVGIRESTGKYITFVDSDDYIDKEMITNLHNELIKKNADTCIGGFKRVFTNKTVPNVNPLAGETFENDQIIKEVLSKMMGKLGKIDDHIEMSVWKVLFSASIIKNNNILFPSEKKFISEDIIFDTDYYSKCKKVCMSNDIGYNYCDNSGSLTTKYNLDRFDLNITLFNELKKRMIRLGIYKSAKQRLYNTLVANTRYCIKLDQKFNDKKNALKKINNICNNHELHQVLNDYLDNEPLKSRFINMLISNGAINTLWYVMFLKNKFNI